MVTRWDDKANSGMAAVRLDPYVRWALHSEWRGYARQARWRKGNEEWIWIIAEAPDANALAAAAEDGRLRVPPEYRVPPVHGARLPLFFTGRIQRRNLWWLIDNPLRLRWKLAMPLREPDTVADPSLAGEFGQERDLGTMKRPNLVADVVRKLGKIEPPGVVKGAIAIIDYGCPFLHTAFQTPMTTRIAALWDQGEGGPVSKSERKGPGWPWKDEAEFGYGRVMGPAVIQALASEAGHRRELDERDIYAGIDHLVEYQDPRRRVWYGTHGGHVMDMAAGAPDPLTGRADDPASRAKILFIQLPLPIAADSGGSALAPHLLDGVRYAMRHVENDDPLVVNISYGGQAGPHDGSSLAERALDDLLELRRTNFAIVLAAGNARHAQSHARRTVRRDRSALLRFNVSAFDTTDTFVEVWYTRPPKGCRLRMRARGPDELWSPWVAPGTEVALRGDGVGREVLALLRHDLDVPDGKRAQALLALAPTAQPEGVAGPLAGAGRWDIEIALVQPRKQDRTVEVDAWIERDEPGIGSGGERPYFVDQDVNDRLGTVSNIATGDWTVRVGGFNRGLRREAPYSALGPPERPLPWVWAVCEDDETRQSIDAAATRSGERFPLNGTSVAAPAVARRLYNWMASGNRVGFDQQEDLLKRLVKGGDPNLALFDLPKRR